MDPRRGGTFSAQGRLLWLGGDWVGFALSPPATAPLLTPDGPAAPCGPAQALRGPGPPPTLMAKWGAHTGKGWKSGSNPQLERVHGQDEQASGDRQALLVD